MSDNDVFKGVPLISPETTGSTSQDKLDKTTFPTEWFEFDTATNRLYLKDGYSFTLSGGTFTVTGNTNVTGSLDVDANLNVDGTSTQTGVVTATAGGTSPVGFLCPRALYAHTETSTTNGGTATSGSDLTVPISAEIEDTIGASLSTSVITIPAGTYDIDAWHIFNSTDYSVIKLYNVTTSAIIKIGSSNFNPAAQNATTESKLTIRITFAATTQIKLVYNCSTTRATYGLGVAVGKGTETYGEVKIVRVG